MPFECASLSKIQRGQRGNKGGRAGERHFELERKETAGCLEPKQQPVRSEGCSRSSGARQEVSPKEKEKPPELHMLKMCKWNFRHHTTSTHQRVQRHHVVASHVMFVIFMDFQVFSYPLIFISKSHMLRWFQVVMYTNMITLARSQVNKQDLLYRLKTEIYMFTLCTVSPKLVHRDQSCRYCIYWQFVVLKFL